MQNIILHFKYPNFISCIALLFLNISIFSETILLKGKETIRGKVKNQNTKSVKIEVNGKIQEVSKDRILKIVYRDLTKEEEEKIRQEEESKLNKNTIKPKPVIKEKLLDPVAKETKEKPVDSVTSKEKDNNENKKPPEEIKIPEKEIKPSEPNKITKPGILFRSALFPGWGQLTQKRYLPALFYSTSFLGVGVLAYNENKRYINSLKDYNNMSNPPLANQLLLASLGVNIATTNYQKYLIYNQKNRVKQHYVLSRNLAFATLSIYILNLLDAYFFYKEDKLSINKFRGFQFDYELRANSNVSSLLLNSTKFDEVYLISYSIQY